MTNFWYPYSGLAEATQRIGRFADQALSPACGISFSDGTSVSVIRRPHATSGTAFWLNVLREHVAAPPPAPPKSHGLMQKLGDWFTQAMTAYGQSELDNAQMQLAGSNAMISAVDAHVWQPTHQWLLKHKLINDAVGVVVDVVGVVAGIAFVVTIGPEIGAVAIATGVVALAGSVILFLCDGSVFGAEVTGNEALSKRIEDNKVIQWARIVGTLMILPDIPVGGVRALKEIGSLAEEAKAARASAVTAQKGAEAQRARIANIHNPLRHPRPIQKHAHRAARYAALAIQKQREATAATHRLGLIAVRDVNASFIAAPIGTALIAAAPPSILLSKEQLEKDEKLVSLLTPEHGMPRDVKLEMRITSSTRVHKE